MKYFAIYKGDDYLYDGTLREVSLRLVLPENHIENVMTDIKKIERSIDLGYYEDLFIAVEVSDINEL